MKLTKKQIEEIIQEKHYLGDSQHGFNCVGNWFGGTAAKTKDGRYFICHEEIYYDQEYEIEFISETDYHEIIAALTYVRRKDNPECKDIIKLPLSNKSDRFKDFNDIENEVGLGKAVLVYNTAKNYQDSSIETIIELLELSEKLPETVSNLCFLQREAGVSLEKFVKRYDGNLMSCFETIGDILSYMKAGAGFYRPFNVLGAANDFMEYIETESLDLETPATLSRIDGFESREVGGYYRHDFIITIGQEVLTFNCGR